MVLTVTELLVVPALVLPLPMAWFLVLALLATFAAVQLRTIWRGDSIACHCFNATELVDVGSLLRSIWFCGTATIGLVIGASRNVHSASEMVAVGIVIAIAGTGSLWTKGAVAVRRELWRSTSA
jgi:hypothetical protein